MMSFALEGFVRTRIVTSVVVAALVLLGTTACNFVAPQATLKDYDPSDGVSATIGNVKVLNTMVISEDGEEGNLVTSVVNNGSDRVQLNLQYESGSTKVNKKFAVGAGHTQKVGTPDGMQLILEGIDAKPGDLMPIYIQYGNEEGKQLLVPVLDGTLDEYADLLP